MKLITDAETITSVDNFISRARNYELVIILTDVNLVEFLQNLLTQVKVSKVELREIQIFTQNIKYSIYAPELEIINCGIDNFHLVGDTCQVINSSIDNSSLEFNNLLVNDIRSINCKFNCKNINFISSDTLQSLFNCKLINLDYSTITSSKIETKYVRLYKTWLANGGNRATQVITEVVEEIDSIIDYPIVNYIGKILK